MAHDGSAKRQTDTIRRAAIDEHGVRGFRLEIVHGRGKGNGWDSVREGGTIGSDPSNEVVLEDPAVSRFHCEVRIDAGGFRLRDLGSKNGTTLDGVRILEAYLKSGSLLKLGLTTLQFQLRAERIALPISNANRFGSLVGRSVAMRRAFALMEQAAQTQSTVLLEGETGTGKEGAAEAIHLASTRRDGPLVVVDCASIPANLIESELFGHEKGSFTGAINKRVGAFAAASGGTIFLDEIGELAQELQPKLLRVLERREVRPIGASAAQAIDVRVIAATNRDLRAEVNAGRLRSDLYFRLAVVKVRLPPLRDREEDFPELVETLLARLGATGEQASGLRSPEFIAELASAAWPGNVRELRNHLERCLVYKQPLPFSEGSGLDGATAETQEPQARNYATARRQALELFEQNFIRAALARHEGRVAKAAAESGLDRVYFYKLLRRHGWTP